MNHVVIQPGSLQARISLHYEVAALIRDMILRHELNPGDKIVEQALCDRFGVSRTPVREAIKVLSHEGIIELLANRGARVAKITPDEIAELFPIIGALEALAGEMACRRLNDGDLARIRALHDEMVGYHRQNNHADYARINRAIHHSLFEIAGNPELLAIYQRLNIRIHGARYIARKSPARWRQAIEEHELMIQALEARDGERLAGILRTHLRHKAEMVNESLAGL
ncbi:GntR family transcriptional regulator [Sodalis sp. RH21]|uniref:GntR family transcriptional regulator n=1 Tax=unclassified Sodalis (in: enterobacteria) TaxID=2636512 RepID=UPI0039B640E4